LVTISVVERRYRRKIDENVPNVSTAREDHHEINGNAEDRNDRQTSSMLSTEEMTHAQDADISPLIPLDLLSQLNATIYQARQTLIKGSSKECIPRLCTFHDVETSLPLPSSLFQAGDRSGQGRKAMIRPQAALASPDSCVVYGFGIAKDSSFEQTMSQYCHQVHGFDCTLTNSDDAVKNMNFTFHSLCVGSPTSINSVERYGNISSHQLTFESSLVSIMQRLGHKHLDILKLDIEGSEWEILENQVEHIKPRQLLFELHSYRAKRKYVPHELVLGKDRKAVNALFLKLLDMGYRVMSKTYNVGDAACAEFSLVLVESTPRKTKPALETIYMEEGECPDELGIC
jgi:hypothetical protein